MARSVQLRCLLLGNVDFRCQRAAGTESFAAALCREKPATGSFFTNPTSANMKPSGPRFFLEREMKTHWKSAGKGLKSILLVWGLWKKSPLCWTLGLSDRAAIHSSLLCSTASEGRIRDDPSTSPPSRHCHPLLCPLSHFKMPFSWLSAFGPDAE